MSRPLEDYALLSDTHTAAIVSNDGAIDWWCVPRFDSPACFASLLGTPDNGFWRIGPADGRKSTRRAYRAGTLVLETYYETETGTARVVECMPHRHKHPTILRLVQGLSGSVEMRMEIKMRFDYGRVVPWVQRVPGGLHAIAGPDALQLITPVDLINKDLTTVAQFTVREGINVPFNLAWYPAHEKPPQPLDAAAAIARDTDTWEKWSHRCQTKGRYRDDVISSLTVLKGLIYDPTGGVVAAATTSLPEELGGERNWDYRYTWLRDASMTVSTLAANGYPREAKQWRDWLMRAVAGDPKKMQIMYGVAGERRLPESTLDWLPGYANSKPVRVGNAAAEQFQLDVYGEVLDAGHIARTAGISTDHHDWSLQTKAADFVEQHWAEADEGIWETRGGRKDFVHSKVMAWVAMDRAARGVADFGLPGDAARWRAVANEIHADVCAKGYNADLGAFTQSYGSTTLDAATLLLPVVGFLPGSDPRIVGTVRAIQRELADGPLVRRYQVAADGGFSDGLSGSEGSFLICSFWLVHALAAIGDEPAARANFEQLLALRNDVGLLSEEYDGTNKRLVGNIPQAFSHIGLLSAATALHAGPDHDAATAERMVTNT